MTLPRFYPRVGDAITPILHRPIDLEDYLGAKVVSLEAPTEIEDYPLHVAGFLLAANLSARLYPRIRLIAPPRVTEECAATILRINPLCEVDTAHGPSDAQLVWARPARTATMVSVMPAGWKVVIDAADARPASTNMLVSLAAAAIGSGEVFRTVFADWLPTGRRHLTPGVLDLLTFTDSAPADIELPSDVHVGRVHLAGAGAIGQAFVYTLARVSASGTLLVVDPEEVSLSNLQRYVLASDNDVGASKCSLASRALRGSRVDVEIEESAWDLAIAGVGVVDTVCTAVDTEAVRIAIQASLPRQVYNAWTQPADLGWSRHERFGEDPCLACLYWPDRPRPSFHELVARAVRQDELRVLAYLTHRLPVDAPLRAEQIPRLPNLPTPANSSSWVDRSLLEDIGGSLGVESTDLAQWRGRQLSDLYREGICGGAIIQHEGRDGTPDMAVPLVHQSVLAGIMLASQLLVANSPELRSMRPPATEGRFNVLAGLPQVILRPRERTRNCMCSDPDFIDRHREKWNR